MNESLEQLEQKREGFRTRMYYLMLEIAVIFAAPAVIAGLLLKTLGGQDGFSVQVQLAALGATFVISWFFVVMKYRKASRQLADIQKAIVARKQAAQQ